MLSILKSLLNLISARQVEGTIASSFTYLVVLSDCVHSAVQKSSFKEWAFRRSQVAS